AAQAGSVKGTVSDSSGAPVAGALVTVDRTTLRAITTASGQYQLRGVPKGNQTLLVRAIGFVPASTTVEVAAADETTKNGTMARSPVELAPIDVVIGSRGRHTAAEELAVPVDVYTPEEIKATGTTETSQIIAALSPSVNVPHQSVTDAND